MKLLRRTWGAFIIFALLGGMAFNMRSPFPAYAASPYLASDLLGQLDENDAPFYTSSGPDNRPNSRGFSSNAAVALDSVHHRLFVSDVGRVLMYDLDSSNTFLDRKADAELGQVDFKTYTFLTTQSGMADPISLAYDASGDRLFVADLSNNRVMVFDVASITNGENAVNVIGQSDFVTQNPGPTSQSNINGPLGLEYDGATQRLFVSAAGSNRVMVFDVDPAVLIPNDAGTDGPDAINVIGQDDFTSGGIRNTRDGLNGPTMLTYDAVSSRLFVPDSGHNRVTVFNADPAVLIPNDAGTDGPNAINVLGQDDFTSFGFATTRDGFKTPQSAFYESVNKRLFVGDYGNNRVMVFNADPAVLIANNAGTDGPNAINVIGQTDYVTGTPATTQNGLSLFYQLAFNVVNNNLFVSDTNNNRVMVFDADPAVLIPNDAGTDGPNAVDLLGQLDENDDPLYTSSGAYNTPNTQGFSTPRGTALDEVHHRLFVMEYANNRVMVFNLDSNNDLIDHSADFVLGQPDFKIISAGTTQSKLSNPFGMTYDSTNDRLFVGDYGNNRVMVFDTTSITNGENAVNVLGQADFITPDSATTQSGLWGPDNIAYETTNKRLFVNDYNNSRVMVFNADPAVLIANTPATDGPLAINVLGEDDYVTAAYVTTQDGLSGPDGLAYDATGKRLFVGDPFANRVMVYNVDPAVLIPNNAGTNGPDAINVLGQTDYTTPGATTTQSGLSAPDDLIYDSATNQLFVADYGNGRVMVFDVATIVDGENALSVLGVADFDSAAYVTTQSGLSGPDGLAYDAGSNRLFISDTQNHRVLVFDLVRITTPDSLPAGTVGTPYSQDIDTEHEQGTVGFSVVSGSLPPGLVIGSITGTPTTAGSYTFTVRASDDNGAIGSFVDDQSYTIVIAAGPTPTPAPGGGGGGGVPGGPPASTPTPTPSSDPLAAAHLKEGDTISAAHSSDPDVYIVNALGYKRLFLNPIIFSFYGHLGGFANVKSVTPQVRDSFVTSGLFRNCETGDPKVYGFVATGEDTGELRWVNTTGAQAVADDANFFKKVFCINTKEFNWYPQSTSVFTSVRQVPDYRR